jgi:hypothetical protein
MPLMAPAFIMLANHQFLHVLNSRFFALGLPKVENGKLVGWIEKPDGQMLRYFLQTLGKDEGFGTSVDITSGGEALPQVINLICDTKASGPSAPQSKDGE